MALRCKQCGDTKDDNGWTVCGECMTRNEKYRRQCITEARRIRSEWQRLKRFAEAFVVACERGRYSTRG